MNRQAKQASADETTGGAESSQPRVRRPEKMLAWLSLHWSSVDAAVGGVLLLRPRRELVQAWGMMSVAVAVAMAFVLFAVPLTAHLPSVYREAGWFQLVVLPAGGALLAAPPIALAMVWLTGRALARERKAEVSPLSGRLLGSLGRVLLLVLPQLMAATIVAHGFIVAGVTLSRGSAIPALLESVGWALAIGVLAGWVGPSLMYVATRVVDGRDNTLAETRNKVRALKRLAYGRHVMLSLLFLLLLGIVYIVAYSFYVTEPGFFTSPAGRLMMALIVGLPAGLIVAHATATAVWTYTRLTMRDSLSEEALAAMTTATASLVGVSPSSEHASGNVTESTETKTARGKSSLKRH